MRVFLQVFGDKLLDFVQLWSLDHTVFKQECQRDHTIMELIVSSIDISPEPKSKGKSEVNYVLERV